ncbi:MAG: hypothetical protein IJ560_02460 [Alphaproteobacteria bacterium]|nr:hypothetical protein [Alphaproteobacteria bacterium]
MKTSALLFTVIMCSVAGTWAANAAPAAGVAGGDWVNKYFVDFTYHDHRDVHATDIGLNNNSESAAGQWRMYVNTTRTDWSQQEKQEKSAGAGVVIGVDGNQADGTVDVNKSTAVPVSWISGAVQADGIATDYNNNSNVAQVDWLYNDEKGLDVENYQDNSGSTRTRAVVKVDGTTVKFNTSGQLQAAGMADVEYKNNVSGTTSTSNDVNNYNTSANKGMIVSSVEKITQANGDTKLRATLDNIKVPVGSATVTNKYATIWIED